MKNIKRRSFIKNTSIITGGLVLPSFSLKKNKIDYSKKLKISVVGCGGRGTGAAVQALRADQNVELIANAPHIPIHLGAMSDTIKFLIRKHFDTFKK